MTHSDYDEIKVGIDSIYHGLTALVEKDGPRWNGFLVPYFDRPNVDRIIRQTDQAIHEDDNAAMNAIRVDWYAGMVRLRDPNYTDEPEYVKAVYIDGVPYWPVGAAAWTWMEE